MKKIIFLILIIVLPIIKVNALQLPEEVNITADAMILYNIDEDAIIYSKNIDKKEILASLTKIMTAYTVIQNVDDLDKKVTVTKEDISNLYGFTCVGLEEGDKVTYRDLLYGMMLVSGADASQTLANHLGGSTTKFVKMMNEEAQKLGLVNSNFADSYGGDDNNVSTPREMAILLKTALKNETFKKVFSTNYYTMSNGLRAVNYTASIATFHGLDSELLTGNKSGFTPEAGLLLASTATINKNNYLLIVFKSEVNEYKSSHVLDTYRIYNYISGLSFQKYTVLKKGTVLKRIPVENGTISEYVITADKDITAILTEKDYSKLEYDIHIAKKITPSNKKGDNLGYVDIKIGDEIIDSYNVYLKDEIFQYKKESKIAIVAIIILIFISLILLCTNILTMKKRKF